MATSQLNTLLEDSAIRYADRTALIHNDQSITFSELEYRSTALANRIISFPNHRYGNRIGICAPKSIECVIGIFGILKSGAAYVPVGYDMPADRNSFIFDHCHISHLLLHNSCRSLLNSWTDDCYTIEGADLVDFIWVSFNRAPTHQQEELAYILYTSGSTGTPKGVPFTHTQSLSFINWCAQTFDADENSVLSSHAPFHFDLSILDLFFSIRQGSSLVLIDDSAAKNPRQLAQLIDQHKITHWYSTPTVLKLMLTYGKIERFDHSSLRYVLFAGEVFPIEPLRQLTKTWTSARFFNLYGPTETNVCTYYELPLPISEERTESFPIGRPCEHFEAMIQMPDASGIGELCISGSAVSSGYWMLPNLNKQMFFRLNDKVWYATGDLVKNNGDDGYIYIGRKDRMIKKHGFRIEPMEIEACLYRHPKIVDAAVIARKIGSVDYRIEAYWTSRQPEVLTQQDLRTFCLENLPYYMMPDAFFEQTIPKTSTDKTDYQMLLKGV